MNPVNQDKNINQMNVMPKVMIIDDDRDIAEVVELILVHHGFEVVKILDGRKVLEILSLFQPDMILLDVNLADIDGRDLCKELKSDHSPYKHTPIVLFSAMHNLEETYEECKATDFISKPFNASDLVRILKKHASQ